jgi:pimeloyl-ACP methyl ester carboxylesterase
MLWVIDVETVSFWRSNTRASDAKYFGLHRQMTELNYNDDNFVSIQAADAHYTGLASSDDVTLAMYTLPSASATAPALIWGHANGFSAGSYLPFLQGLSSKFRVFAYDVRGHGGSTRPAQPLSDTLTFDSFAFDLRIVTNAVRAQLGEPALYFAGHSFSAAAMFHLGGQHGYAPWAAVTTFDATMLPCDVPSVKAEAQAGTAERIARTLGRRDRWASIDDCVATLGRPGVFDNWHPALLRAHCEATLRPLADGGYGLACAPDIEAGVYAGVMDTRPYAGLPKFSAPALLVAADRHAKGTWVADVQARASERLANAETTTLAGCGHLMVFEQPALCAQLVMSMLES